jgi:hypothetical protein
MLRAQEPNTVSYYRRQCKGAIRECIEAHPELRLPKTERSMMTLITKLRYEFSPFLQNDSRLAHMIWEKHLADLIHHFLKRYQKLIPVSEKKPVCKTVNADQTDPQYTYDAESVKAFMKQRNISLNDLASATDISYVMICQICSGSYFAYPRITRTVHKALSYLAECGMEYSGSPAPDPRLKRSRKGSTLPPQKNLDIDDLIVELRRGSGPFIDALETLFRRWSNEKVIGGMYGNQG